MGRCCANFLWFAAAAAAIVAAASQCPIGTATASGLSAALTADTAFADPGGLPTAARVLRERRRSRGGGSAFSAFLVEPPDGARTEPHGFGVAAVARGVDAPRNGGCAGARALRSCTTPTLALPTTSCSKPACGINAMHGKDVHCQITRVEPGEGPRSARVCPMSRGFQVRRRGCGCDRPDQARPTPPQNSPV